MLRKEYNHSVCLSICDSMSKVAFSSINNFSATKSSPSITDTRKSRMSFLTTLDIINIAQVKIVPKKPVKYQDFIRKNVDSFNSLDRLSRIDNLIKERRRSSKKEYNTITNYSSVLKEK